ncbi:T9SS type B sorting domain-containing protein [Flavobacterium litorale]|uniref:T9SS type B sorting domain-containing protein n=1 Tax=Flavobacterium litorale TaxID=2856519 RepID=A0ABX8V4H8_9FLAO|nr:T9SS type B sorting domain-containing protein [Flavobacterium litorale]QYJ67741.1 T9SS type B sorting domain-containing protein [Flavobacterium litorale]
MFFFSLVVSLNVSAQIYQHNFGNTPITANPYTGTPSILNANLSGSSWTNNTGAWLNVNGSSSSIALSATSPTAATSIFTEFTLTFDIAAGKELEITSFNFWRRRTPSAAQTWSMTINGIAVGNGSAPITGANTGTTPVLNPVTGLTGTVTVIVRFNNSATGSGSLVIDDFTLNGSITDLAPPCALDVTTFSPTTGPENTLVTFTGTGFNDATGVTFDGITATFAALSDTEMIALVPNGVTAGNIEVTGSGCTETVTGNFNIITSECQSDIYISEIYDNNGGSFGVIELYNPSGNTVNLGGQYVLERYGNIGDPSPSTGYIVTLAGSIAPYSTYLVSSSTSSPTGCPNSFDDNIGNGINANDEFKLKKNGVIIDVARAPNFIGYTVIRNANADAPTATYSSGDWTVTSNDCGDLGSHTADPSSGNVPDITHPATESICENETAIFSVSLTGTGYSYQWRVLNSSGNWINVTNDTNYTGATTNTLTITGVPFGFDGNQYYCEITSSNCDLVSNAAQLNVTEAPTPVVGTATPSSCTADTGTITITSPVAFGISYSINGIDYQFANTFNDLPAGDYTVTARNLSNCVSTPVTITVSEAGAPDVATTTVTQPTCTEPNGTITVDAPTGTGFSYSINGIDFQTDVNFTGLAPATYNITTMNAIGCTSVTPDIVINPFAALPAATTTVTQPTCDVTTGTIEVTAPLGAQYTYSLDGISYFSTTTFSNLAPGTYTITTQDGGGCISVTGNIVINNVPDAPVLGTLNITQPTCEAGGRIFVLSPLGAAYTYSIDGVNYQTNPIFENVAAGTYQVTVQTLGCISAPETAVINQNSAPDCIENPNLTNDFPPSSDDNLAAKGSWYTSHGSPTSGTSSIWMWSYAGNGEGTYTCYNFESGKEYRICISLINENIPGTLGYVNPDANFYIQASNGAFTPTPTPTGNQTIANWHATDQTITDYTYTFTANNNYSKLWFFPYMLAPAMIAGDEYKIRLHSVKVEEVITNPTINVVGTTATIIGTPTTGGSWLWEPAALVTSQNADNSVVILSETCSSEIVTATFISDCEICSTYTVQTTTPTVPLAAPTVTTTQPDCEGTVAQIEVTAPAGAGFTYSIGGAYQSSPIFNGLAAGNYNVTVEDNSGCISEITVATINTIPNAPATATTTVTQPTCTEPNGTIEVTSPTGAGLEYSINGMDFQTSTIFTVPAGTYNITTKNADGCTSVTENIVINPAPTIPANAVVNYIQPTCTEATGTITINSPTGAGLTYSINNGADYQASNVFTGQAPGNYTVLVQNADGCISNPVTATVNPTPTVPANAVVSYIQPTCTEPTGTITIDSPTGEGLTYSINNGTDYQASNVFTGQASGNYTVLVQNADGCISNPITATVNPVPTAPADATVSYIQPTCTEPTGTITIDSPTGAGLMYSINNGVDYQASNVFSVLAPGDYSVVVQNADGCTSNAVTATVDDAPTLAAATYTVTPLGCNDTTGTITVTSTNPDYTYSIGGAYQSSPIFTGLVPNSYVLTIQDINGCTSAPIAVTIDAAPTLPADAAITVTQPNCNNPLGIITINAPLGAGLTYSINGGDTYQNVTNFVNVTPGNYSVLVKNASGCVSENPQAVTINPAPIVPAAATYTSTNPTCTSAVGSITITAPLGTNLEYSINNGASYSNALVYNNLTPDTYQLIVRNTVGGCTSNPVNITINPSPNTPEDAVVTASQPECNSTAGAATITFPLGVGYTYSINGSDYQSSTTFFNLAPGDYLAYVKNAAGCIADTPTPFTINDAPAVPDFATVTITNPDCTTPTGSIEVTAPLGAEFTYSIDGENYQTETTFTDVVPGTYTITVQNTDGCTSLPVTRTVQPQPDLPTIPTVSITQTDCDSDTGKIVVTSPFGANFSYSINGGVDYQANTTFPNVTPGDYTITVRNAEGCTATSGIVTVDAPPAPAPDPGINTGTTAICEGETTQLENEVENGIWLSSNENIATVDDTGLVTSIKAGTVTISYTVGTVCTDAATTTVTINPLPVPTLEEQYYLCQDTETETYESIVLNSGLSISNYSFIWKKEDTVLPFLSGFIVVDEPGTYSVEATNLTTGCIGTTTTTVGVSSTAIATAKVATDFNYQQTITVNVTGGSGDYEFSLNGGAFQDENVFTNITEGLYTIIVNDKNGCEPIVLEVYALNYPRFFSPNGDGTHETWNINGLTGQNTVIYIYDRYGKAITSVIPGQLGWDGTYNGKQLPATDYWFTLTYESSDGTNKEFKAHFSLLR